MFGKVQEDSFQNIFDFSLDSDDTSVIGSEMKIQSHSSLLKQNNQFKSFGGLFLDLDDHSSCWRDSLLALPQEDAFSNEDDEAFFLSVKPQLSSGFDADLKLKSKKLAVGSSGGSGGGGGGVGCGGCGGGDGGSSSASSTCSNSSLQSNKVNTSRYKTELCRPFQENGICKYGEKCQFAHGHHELRTVIRHPKYKTDLCRTYHSVGFCPYGPRCHFIHSLDEMAPSQTSTSSTQKNSPAASPAPSTPATTSAPPATSSTTTCSSSAHSSPSLTPTAALTIIKPLPMFSPDRNVRCNPEADSLPLLGLGGSCSSASSVGSPCSLSPSLLPYADDLKISESRLPVFSSLIK